MNEQEWINIINQYDPKIKFCRLEDEKIGEHQKNGKLQVKMVYSRGDNRGKYYFCQCDCGKNTTVWGNHFRSEHTKSCGCYMIESGRKNMIALNQTDQRFHGYDLTGQIINNFKIIKKIGQNTNHDWIYECICPICQNICYKTKKGLEKDLSCGCVKKSKGEEKISEILTINKIPFIKQKSFNNCKNTNVLKFDFYIDNKYLIEYDGIQHFEATGGWFTEETIQDNQKRDQIKNQYCKEHNIPLIRIPYTHLDNLCLEDLLLETSKFIYREEV